VRQVVDWLEQQSGARPLELDGVEENIVFSMPRDLRAD
jgi:hypothetical protein